MYNIIMDTLEFEWDPNKNEINKKKHGLSFETAKEVFYDEFALLFDDPDHSIEEERFLIIGAIKTEKICIVSHCYRSKENRIRIISARQATKTEQQQTPQQPEHAFIGGGIFFQKINFCIQIAHLHQIVGH